MKFIEARKIVAAFEGGPPLDFLLAMSGQPEPLEPFLEAAAAERGFEARVRTLPFNTLPQALRSPPEEGGSEVFLLFPWDLLPEVDWRSGFPERPRALPELLDEVAETLDLVRRRGRPPVLYVDAPVPPLYPDHHRSAALASYLRAAALESGATLLPEGTASLENLFRSGSPLASSALGSIAREIVAAATRPAAVSGKVLVTDFDNTLWRGVVGEDGVEGLHYEPSGLGFPHFVYQTFLKRLKASGVLVAGVTRNDPDLAEAPLRTSGSVLDPDDFVSILASYNPKSAQIEELATRLNLGLDAFAFVDDNPVELAEVDQVHPQVSTVRFPERVADLPAMLARLSDFFHREGLTDEDRERTDMYRRRLEGLVPKDVEGADLRGFLAEMEMSLTIRDRSTGDRERAVQLINKTNQFNLNGIRRSDEEVARVLEAGGRLYTAALSDRHGSHGEILAFLVEDDRVLSFVLSCRVFQRRLESAFLVWLADRAEQTLYLDYAETERNEAFRRLLRDPAFEVRDGGATLDLKAFAAHHGADLDLFDVETP